MGNNIKTKMDEFVNEEKGIGSKEEWKAWWNRMIGKEETPEEVYRREKIKHEKEQAKLRDKGLKDVPKKPVDPNDPYDEEPDDEVADVRAAKNVENRLDMKRRYKGYPTKSSSPSPRDNDPYGEEVWDERRERRDQRRHNRYNRRKR